MFPAFLVGLFVGMLWGGLTTLPADLRHRAALRRLRADLTATLRRLDKAP